MRAGRKAGDEDVEKLMTLMFELDKDRSTKDFRKELTEDLGSDSLSELLHGYLRQYDPAAFNKLLNLLNIYDYQ